MFNHLSASLLGHDEPQLARWLFWLLAAVVAGVAALLVLLGPPIVIRFIDDIPILLDGGWRVFQGHVPHVDFYTPLGPVTLLLVGFGMVLAGPSTQSIVAANAVMVVVVSLWAWALSRPRMSAVQSFVFSLYACFLVAGVQVFGWGLDISGFSAVYNRYATALLVLVLVEAFGHPAPPEWRGVSFWGGVSSGVLLVLLFFLKLNYFGMALLGILFGPVVTRYARARWVGLVAGIAVALAGMLGYLRFDIAALVSNLALGVQSRSGMLYDQAFSYLADMFQLFPPQTIVPLWLLFLTWHAAPSPGEQGGALHQGTLPLPTRVRQAALFLFVVMAHIAIFLSNTQQETPALFPLAGLLLLAEYRYPAPASGNTQSGLSPRRTLPLAAYSLLLTAIMVLPNMGSIAFAYYYKSTTEIEKQFDSPSLANLYIKQDSTYGKEYFEKMSDGLALLREHSAPHERIVTLDFTNPFSFGLLRPSPKGDALWWHEGLSFSEEAHPDPQQVFHAADVVMLRQPLDKDETIWEIYGPYVESHFRLTARTDHWRLFHRQ